MYGYCLGPELRVITYRVSSAFDSDYSCSSEDEKWKHLARGRNELRDKGCVDGLRISK
jgi:hypothetical protein